MTRALLGWGLGRAGARERAEDVLTKLIEERDRGYFPAFFIAMVCVGLEEHDRALEWLEMAFVHRDSLLPCLEVGELWDPLRADPRCIDILERIGLG